jgi:hypothetical protein
MIWQYILEISLCFSVSVTVPRHYDAYLAPAVKILPLRLYHPNSMAYIAQQKKT